MVEYKKIMPNDLQRLTREIFPRVLRSLSQKFPLDGIVRRSGNYYYLDLDEGNYQRAASIILNNTESKLSLLPQPGFRTAIVPPPSPVGTHVTLRSNLPFQELGRTYSFELDTAQGIVSYPHEKQGKSPSDFDSTVYPISWYVIYVKGLPNHITDPYDRPQYQLQS